MTRMQTHTTTTFIRRSIFAGAVLALTSITSQAAVVTWGAAQAITGDSNVSTAGTFVGAVNLGGATTTVNGVTFQGLSGIPFGAGLFNSGNFAVSGFFFGDANTGSASAPFSSLSAGYRSLLGSAAAVGGTMTLTMSGLTPGQNYQFQTWVNDSRNQTPPGFTFTVDIAAGNLVTLDPNPTLAEGGRGQYVIGSFLANAVSQQITFANSEVAVINGFQLRLLSAAVAVPEPGSALAGMLALGVCLGGLAGRRRQAK